MAKKKMTVREKVFNFLVRNAGKGFTSTTIATRTKTNWNSVRRVLAELGVSIDRSDMKGKTYYFA